MHSSLKPSNLTCVLVVQSGLPMTSMAMMMNFHFHLNFLSDFLVKMEEYMVTRD